MEHPFKPFNSMLSVTCKTLYNSFVCCRWCVSNKIVTHVLLATCVIAKLAFWKMNKDEWCICDDFVNFWSLYSQIGANAIEHASEVELCTISATFEMFLWWNLTVLIAKCSGWKRGWFSVFPKAWYRCFFSETK